MSAKPLAHAAPASHGALEKGQLMFSRYRLECLLGRGGMGIVWLARDEKLDRQIALKFLPDVLFLDAASRDELKRETRRSLDLTHPNIVRIHDFVEDEQSAAISMEYIDGPCLSQLRVEKGNRCFEARELVGWVADLCRALDYAHHSAGFVHRDLKPANLMVTSRGVLKVADFGIACGLHNTAARISAWNSTGGTLGYMSPQQLEGELAAVTDDVYSVGAALYELLTSKPPFHSGDISLQIRTTVADSMTERRRRLGIAGAPIPEEWEATVAACLAKHPRDRPASVREVARRLGVERLDLSPAESEAPEQLTFVERKPRGSPPPAPPPASGRRVFSGVSWPLIAGGVALVVGTAFALEFSRGLASRLSRADSVSAVAVAERESASAASEPPALPPSEPAAELPPEQPTEIPEVRLQPPLAAAEAMSDRALLLESARLTLRTNPVGLPFALFSGAAEVVDAAPVHQGETPADLENLAPGKYRLVVGATPWPVHIAVVDVKEPSTEFVHEFPQGTVRVESAPTAAEIFVGDDLVGKAPLDIPLPPGAHIITAEYKDRTSRPRNITVVAGEKDKLSFDFRTSNATTTKGVRRRPKKKEETALTKIGRSIQNFFGGDKTKKR